MVSCMRSARLSINGRKLPESYPLLCLCIAKPRPLITLTAHWPTAGISASDWTRPLGGPANHWAARRRAAPVKDYLANRNRRKRDSSKLTVVFSPVSPREKFK